MYRFEPSPSLIRFRSEQQASGFFCFVFCSFPPNHLWISSLTSAAVHRLIWGFGQDPVDPQIIIVSLCLHPYSYQSKIYSLAAVRREGFWP